MSSFHSNRIYNIDPSLKRDLEFEWHRIRLTIAEMIHFIRQMQAYARLEVVECSWMKLINFLNKKEGDLDALIEAHRNYLDQMMKKIFLRSPKAGKEVFFEFSFGPYCHLMVLPLPSIGKSTQPSP